MTSRALQAFVALLGGAVLSIVPAIADVSHAPTVPSASHGDGTSYAALLDPAFSFGAPPAAFGSVPPLEPKFVPFTVATAPAAAPAVAITESAPDESSQVASVPLPVPRPPELQARVEPTAVQAGGRLRLPLRRTAALNGMPSDNRNFLEKFFGVQPSQGPALGYAAPEIGILDYARGAQASTAQSYGPATAVYDIAAHTVYMPSGARLEAHSGLGDRLDDPRYVHERMRGATPPTTYALTPREQLFHGVQALRLIPVGEARVFGRTGLLAHTYMLGPNGDSNGCVSFKNYNAFLQAFQNGEVRRLVVVPRLI